MSWVLLSLPAIPMIMDLVSGDERAIHQLLGIVRQI